METGLRILLLLIGIAVVAGIIWDFKRNAVKRNYKVRSRDTEKSVLDNVEEFSLEMPLEFPNEENFIMPPTITPSKIKLHHNPTREARITPNYSQDKSRPYEPAKQEVIKESPQDSNYLLEDLVLIHVLARRPKFFTGPKLIDALNEAHLFYTDTQIFERFENIDGTGNPVFSLVSAVEPGIFELSKIESFQTPGVTLFFSITRPNKAVAAFELMLRTAKMLATRLDAELRDHNHQLLTAETIERYRDRIRKPLGISVRTSEYR